MAPIAAQDLLKIKRAMEVMQLSKAKEAADKKSYEFWSTQPVPKLDEEITEANEEIEKDIPLANLRQEPYTLPSGFQWDTLNLSDPIVVGLSSSL